MKVHNLKVDQKFFPDLAEGRKSFEVRFDDRGYKTGDLLVGWEWNPETKTATGARLVGKVGYILRDFPALADGHIVFSVATPTMRELRHAIAKAEMPR